MGHILAVTDAFEVFNPASVNIGLIFNNTKSTARFREILLKNSKAPWFWKAYAQFEEGVGPTDDSR